MSDKLTIGVAGYGYWGPNMVRNFFNRDDCRVCCVADLDQSRLDKLNKNYPGIQTFQRAEDMIEQGHLDAIVIATPVSTHYALARLALEKNMHVLVEKPICETAAQAKELTVLAAKKGKCLMVDHTYLYTGAVQTIKKLLDNGELGHLQYIDSVRINLGLFQADVNVLWDLATHDISVCNYLTGKLPKSVNCTGISHEDNGIENITYLTMNYDDKLIVHINSSWTSPVKIRHMVIGGDRKMVFFNDLEPTDKVKVFDAGYRISSPTDKDTFLVDYRMGDTYIPKLSMQEALAGLAEEFVMAISKGAQSISDAQSGLAVMKILEAANKSLHKGGEKIEIKY